MSFLPLLLCVVLIYYLSLYPWRFVAPPVDTNPLLLVLQTWPALTRRIAVDVVTNVAFYVPLGISARWFFERRLMAAGAVAAAAVLGAALSLSVEVTQVFVPMRVSSAADVLANTVGAAFGALVYSVLVQRVRAEGTIRLIRGAAIPFTLVCCWVLGQLYPLIPDISAYRIARKMESIRVGSWPELVTMLADSVTVVLLAAIILRGRRMAALAFCVPLIIPLRIFVVGRSFAWVELMAVGVAAALATVYTRLPRRALLCAAVLIVGVVVRGLAPFDFVAAGAAFQWTPFVSAITGPESSAGTMLLKAFRYGAIVWLLAEETGLVLLPGVFCMSLLAVLEGAQRYFTGHVAESTDPLLAGLLTMMIAAIKRRDRRAGG